MEYCIEARALKPSLRREIATMTKLTNQQAFDDNIWGQTVINGSSGEDFSVDDLFVDGAFELLKDGGGEGEEEKSFKDSFSLSSQERENDENSNSSSCVSGDFQSSFTGELPVPDDDLDNLEWLSQFVDDSVPEFPSLYPAAAEERKGLNRIEPGLNPVPCRPLWFLPPIPSKPRTKRPRITPTVWSSLVDLSPLSLSPSLIMIPVLSPELSYNSYRPVKKQKQNPVRSREPVGSLGDRWCSHCHVQKTPQWRTGPLGPKTLCNACGVRFKSGRLFPEYRPACSPTFCGNMHSNSHRKVLEMRRKKEMVGPGSDY